MYQIIPGTYLRWADQLRQQKVKKYKFNTDIEPYMSYVAEEANE